MMTSPDRKLRRVLRSHGRHWVGDGFPVRTLFGYDAGGDELSQLH